MRYLVIYDISDDQRRRAVFKTLKSYGAWKQYSAFEVDLTKTQKAEMEHDLKELVTAEENIRIYRICESCQAHITELGQQTPDEQSSVV